MKIIRYAATGDLELTEALIPEPGPEEILVRVAAASLEPFSTLPELQIPGSEAAGEIARLGENISRFEIGQRVVIWPYLPENDPARVEDEEAARSRGGMLGVTESGCLTEYLLVKPENLLPMPEDLTFEQAAAQSVTAAATWHALVSRGGISPGEWVLVYPAEGSSGPAAIQVAQLWGAQVIAVTAGNESANKAEEAGAEFVINRATEDVKDRVKEITGGRGVDLVFLTGQDQAVFDTCLTTLAPGGRLVTSGNASVQLDLAALARRQLLVTGSYGASREETSEILNLSEQGRQEVIIDSVYPLENYREALARLANAERFGKIILVF